MNIENLIGRTFGNWLVLYRADDKISPSGKVNRMWMCECQCEQHTTRPVNESNLLRGLSKSCGCLNRKTLYEKTKKYNVYDMSNDVGIGYTSNTNKIFYFDLEDYDKIKDYCWHEDSGGYVTASTYKDGKRSAVRIHAIIMGRNDQYHIDHKNHNTLDNRKENLRVATVSQNQMNTGIRINNTSGATGVYKYKSAEKWFARIKINQKTIHLGTFNSFEDALNARIKAEEKYFGDYSYNNSIQP